MTGEPLTPIRPHLAAAQRDGLVTPEQVTLIDTALRKVKHCDPAAVEAGELLLVQQATQLGYQDLDRVAAKLIEAIDPDGILPADEAEHRLRRFFHLTHRKDGSWAGDFRLTPDVGQKLAALLGPLTKPQTTRFETSPDDTDTDADAPASKHVVADERTQGQRQHDALAAILDAVLRTDDLPAAGGTPTTLLLTMSWEDFLSEHGIGTYTDGSPVSARTARLLADQADIAICFKNARRCGPGPVADPPDRQPRPNPRADRPRRRLHLPRLRCGTPMVRAASCDRLVRRRQHQPANLTLVCSYHHHQFAQRGWQCEINTDGLPVWIPPKWIDRHQRPILNARITINNWDPQDPLNFDQPLIGDPPGEVSPPD